MSVLDKVRRWIDGESAELVLEQAARDARVKPRSKSEEFIVKIARAVEKVMQEEMVPLPQGTTIIPTEYMIFLSPEDDKEWQGTKRKGLEKGLYHILAERAKELAGKKKLETQSFAVELRVDGTLETGDVRVQHGWEDSSASKTGDLDRMPKPPVKGTVHPTSADPPPAGYSEPPADRSHSDTPTVSGSPMFTKQRETYSQIAPLPVNDEEELTAVAPRKSALYGLEVWRGGVRQSVIPIFQSEIVIGRGSRSKPVDVVLKGDPEISRRHLVLILDRHGNFTVINEGRNPATINDAELPVGQRVRLATGQPLSICSYMVRVQTT